MLNFQHAMPMPSNTHPTLSRRERQIMDVLYRRERATAGEVLESLGPDAPGYSAVRAHLRVLEEKGHVRHEAEGQRYVFSPVVSRERARRSALRHVLDTFFEGSVEQVVTALLDGSAKRLSPEELKQISTLIEQARREGR